MTKVFDPNDPKNFPEVMYKAAKWGAREAVKSGVVDFNHLCFVMALLDAADMSIGKEMSDAKEGKGGKTPNFVKGGHDKIINCQTSVQGILRTFLDKAWFRQMVIERYNQLKKTRKGK
jgi:hypothetical protein